MAGVARVSLCNGLRGTVPMDSAGVVAERVVVVVVTASDSLCCTKACGRFRMRLVVVVVAVGVCVVSPGGFLFAGT